MTGEYATIVQANVAEEAVVVNATSYCINSKRDIIIIKSVENVVNYLNGNNLKMNTHAYNCRPNISRLAHNPGLHRS